MDLDGKVAVITGASRGLGAGLAEVFGRKGMCVGLCARTKPLHVTDRCRLARMVDVTDAVAVEAFAHTVAATFGPIDLWINNAGLLDPMGPLRDVDLDAFRRLIDVNVVGVASGTQAFLRHALRPGGTLINISSGAALKPYAGWAAYCASKAAVDRMTECVAIEEPDLRVHAVAPGIIDTDMQARIRAASAQDFPMREKFVHIKEAGAFSSPGWVAEHLLDIAFGPRRDEVVLRLPAERAP